MDISGNTRLIAHIGYPTQTFKAPLIYNPYFQSAGLDVVVVPFASQPDGYPALLRALFTAENVVGALITMPHKVSTCGLLDRVSATAQIAGACNAVRRGADGRLEGDMFDGEGFVRSLRTRLAVGVPPPVPGSPGHSWSVFLPRRRWLPLPESRSTALTIWWRMWAWGCSTITVPKTARRCLNTLEMAGSGHCWFLVVTPKFCRYAILLRMFVCSEPPLMMPPVRPTIKSLVYWDSITREAPLLTAPRARGMLRRLFSHAGCQTVSSWVPPKPRGHTGIISRFQGSRQP